MHKALHKTLRFLIQSILWVSLVLLSASLAFSGMWAIHPGLAWSLLSLLFVAPVEGQVYINDLQDSLKKITRPIKNLIKDITQQWLSQLNITLNDKQLESLIGYLQEKLAHPCKTLSLPDDLPIECHKKIQELLQDIEKKRQLLLYVIVPLIAMTSAGTAFTTATAFSITLGLIGLTSLSLVVWPLAIIAGIAYGIFIYKTFNDILTNPSFNKYTNKIKLLLKKNSNESQLRYQIRRTAIIASIIAISLVTIGATIATAGTWWWASKKAIPIGKKLLKISINLAGTIGIFFSEGLFAVTNTLQTVSKLFKLPKKLKNNFQHQFHHFQQKPLCEKINPFRALTYTLEIIGRTAFFALNMFAIGTTSDKMPKVPPLDSAINTTLSETVTSLNCQLVDKSSQHQAPENNHPDIAGIIIKTTVAPIYFLSAVWHYFALKRQKKSKSFKNCCRWSFGLQEKEEKKAQGKTSKLVMSKTFISKSPSSLAAEELPSRSHSAPIKSQLQYNKHAALKRIGIFSGHSKKTQEGVNREENSSDHKPKARAFSF